jgi:hypothetical protein
MVVAPVIEMQSVGKVFLTDVKHLPSQLSGNIQLFDGRVVEHPVEVAAS